MTDLADHLIVLASLMVVGVVLTACFLPSEADVDAMPLPVDPDDDTLMDHIRRVYRADRELREQRRNRVNGIQLAHARPVPAIPRPVLPVAGLSFGEWPGQLFDTPRPAADIRPYVDAAPVGGVS